MDRDAANFALLMTGSGEAVMLPGAMREADRRLMTWLARLRFEEALASEAPLAAEGMQWGAPTRGIPTPMRLAAIGDESAMQLGELGDAMAASRNRSMLWLPYESEALETMPGFARQPNASRMPSWLDTPEALLRYPQGRYDTGQCASGVCTLLLRDAGFTDAVGVVEGENLVRWSGTGEGLESFREAVNTAGSPASFLRSLGRRMPAQSGAGSTYATRQDMITAMQQRPPGTRYIVQVQGSGGSQHALYAIRAENGEIMFMHGMIDTSGEEAIMYGAEATTRQLDRFGAWRFREIPQRILDWIGQGAAGNRPPRPPRSSYLTPGGE
jgi:hypothetical protein